MAATGEERNVQAGLAPTAGAAALIAQLEGGSIVGLTAPEEATHWGLEQIQAYFESDGKTLPPPDAAPAELQELEDELHWPSVSPPGASLTSGS